MQQSLATPAVVQLHREACLADERLQLWGHHQMHAEIGIQDQATSPCRLQSCP